MRYELMNRYYGHKIVCESEKSKDHFLANAKKDPKDNQSVWVVTKELPDGPEKPKFSKEELLAMLAELESEDSPKETVDPKPVVKEPKKRGPKPKGKHLGDPGSSMRP